LPKRVLERALAAVQAAQVDERTRRLAQSGAIDLTHPEPLTAWAMDTPVAVVAALLGWDDAAARDVAAAVRDFIACLSPLATPDRLERASVAAAELTARARSLLQSAGAEDAGLAAQVAAGARDAGWTDEAGVVANVVGLLSQTCEATAGLIGNAVVALATRPTLLDEVRTMPDGWDALVEETSRHDPPVQNTRRFVAQATHIGGVALAPGDAVLLVLAAANRDPQLNPEPQRFRLDRPQRRVVTFGRGVHACPGQALACRIASVALRTMFEAERQDGLRHLRWTYRASVNARVPVFHRIDAG
jgi:cytochrome P450